MSHNKDPLSVALIGLGRVAEQHLKAIRFWESKGELVLAAVVDPKQDIWTKKLQAAGFQRKIPGFNSIEDMLQQVVPDICAITSNSGSHFGLAELALQAGCHLLVEKPFTLDLDEADQLIDLAENKKLKIAVGHIYRYMITIRELQSDLAAGVFGRILHAAVIVRWGHDQTYYNQADWRGSWSEDGGALMNQTVHALDLMTYLCQALPVTATAEIARLRHDIEAEDYGLGIFCLNNGALLSVEGTTAGFPGNKEASFFLQAENGTIRASIYQGKLNFKILDKDGRSLGRKYIRRSLANLKKRYGLRGLSQIKNPHTAIYDDLITAIRKDQEPLASGISGRDAVAMVLSLYQAAREKRTVDFPPTDRKITPQDIS
ncbi:MAG TPA: Gfo/Idh/MocA family oxidoreductase [Clostridiaceae bacterium]|nr:Gfo/Idh/MocA family oxidoreductase [Clostridiaceae bacterium]